jgi:orotate phosphoribosyltransferase
VVHSGKRIARALDFLTALGGVVVGIACIVRRANISDSGARAETLPYPLWSALEV